MVLSLLQNNFVLVQGTVLNANVLLFSDSVPYLRLHFNRFDGWL
jgi:hypothetical protein